MDITIIVGLIVVFVGVVLFAMATPKQKAKMYATQGESTNSPLLVKLLFIVAIGIALMVILSDVFFPNFWADVMPSTQGWVTSVEFKLDTDGDYYRVGYAYEIDGQSYEGTGKIDDDASITPSVGGSVTVYYLPGRADYSFLYPTAPFSNLFVIFAFGAAGIALLWSLITGQPLRPAD